MRGGVEPGGGQGRGGDGGVFWTTLLLLRDVQVFRLNRPTIKKKQSKSLERSERYQLIMNTASTKRESYIKTKQKSIMLGEIYH